METLLQDIRYGLRMLLRSPGFTAIALLTLAIGIGANTAIFSVVNTVLLRPLPYKDPARLVMLWQSSSIFGSHSGASAPEYLDYRDRNRSFQNMGAYASRSFNLTGGHEPQRIKAARVTASLFDVLGVSPILGRTISQQEDQTSGPKVVLLGFSLWRNTFNGNSNIVGTTVTLDAEPYTVIGVMPPSFRFPFDGTPFSDRAELWVPMAFTAHELQARAESFDFRMVARLSKDVSLEQAASDVSGIANAIVREYPNVYSGNVKMSAIVESLAGDIIAKVRPVLLILLSAVGFVLLIACANVANLLLARAAARNREIVVRTAIGASPARLIRQMLTESTVLSLAGGLLGLGLAVWLVKAFREFGPEQLPRVHEVNVDPGVLGFALVISLLTGFIFGLFPALRVSHLSLGTAIKDAARQSGEGRERHRSRNLLIVVETASALLLLVGAGLLINSFLRILRVPPGINPDGVLIARTAFDRTRYPNPEQRKTTQEQLITKLSALRGVESVGLFSELPFSDERRIGFRIEGADPNQYHQADNDMVSNDYFRAMGISLLKGRTFADQDRRDTPPVAVINQAMARQFWPGEDPIGKRILWGGRPAFTIVGIVNNVQLYGLDIEAGPAIYFSVFQVESGISFQTVFAIRTSGSPAALIPAVRNQIWSVDKELPIYDVSTMKDVVAESLAQRRFTLWLLTSFAGIALFLAAIGLYGVTSYSVTQRTQEMGVRMALGAAPSDLLRLIVASGTRLAAIGIAAGILAALVLTRFMSSMLFGVHPADPLTFVAVSIVLLFVVLLACYIPARRATKIDPMVALRYE
jgi:putative ABC transport system permease protein